MYNRARGRECRRLRAVERVRVVAVAQRPQTRLLQLAERGGVRHRPVRVPVRVSVRVQRVVHLQVLHRRAAVQHVQLGRHVVQPRGLPNEYLISKLSRQ